MICDDLEVLLPEGTGSIAAHAVDIMAWVRQLEMKALHSGITKTFAIARSHYADSINLETMILGFALGYEDSELMR